MVDHNRTITFVLAWILVTLWEEHRLRVFEDSVLREVLGLKVASNAGSRKMHNKACGYRVRCGWDVYQKEFWWENQKERVFRKLACRSVLACMTRDSKKMGLKGCRLILFPQGSKFFIGGAGASIVGVSVYIVYGCI
jgi:hypothetical protein